MFQFANVTLKARWMSATTGSAVLVFVVASLPILRYQSRWIMVKQPSTKV